MLVLSRRGYLGLLSIVQVELRENKMRLDREFSAMLVKIADRRETLSVLEKQLQTLDRTRSAKKDELRQLERKLVVLLEEQHLELESIKARQLQKKSRMTADLTAIVPAKGGSASGGAAARNPHEPSPQKQLRDGDHDDEDDENGGGGRGGPTVQQVCVLFLPMCASLCLLAASVTVCSVITPSPYVPCDARARGMAEW